MELLLSIGFCITGFTIFLLLRKKSHKNIHKFAITILFLWFIRFLLFYLKIETDLTNIPWLYFIDQNLFLLDGVFLFWFSKSINKEKFHLIKESIHLIPFIIAIGLTISLFINYTNEQLDELYQESQLKIATQSNILSLEELIFIAIILLQNIIYLFLCFKKIKRHNQNILSNYSNIDRIQVNWLAVFLKIWGVLMVLPLIIYFLNYTYPLIEINNIEPFLIASFVAIAVYFSASVINQYYVNLPLIKSGKTSKENVQKMDDDELQSIFIKLQKFMSVERAYLDNSLSLGKLSEQMNMKPIKLSYVIKTQTKGNFYDYINNFRIESVKKELTKTKEQIIIIAYNNGFNSKSTFNKVFKCTTGYSPSEFRKTHTP